MTQPVGLSSVGGGIAVGITPNQCTGRRRTVAGNARPEPPDREGPTTAPATLAPVWERADAMARPHATHNGPQGRQHRVVFR
eukprot:COSAG02_NODE_2604_length_8443_cov_6.439593_13_plen_82_part_00